MVVLHIRHGDQRQFLFETNTSASVADTVRSVVELQNLSLQVHRLVVEGNKLVKSTVNKSTAVDKVSEQPADSTSASGECEAATAGCERLTFGCEGSVPQELTNDVARERAMPISVSSSGAAVHTLQRMLHEAEQLIHKDRVKRKVALTKADLEEAIENIATAVAAAYPAGLPGSCPLQQLLDQRATQGEGQEADPAQWSLWFAGKRMRPEAVLADHVGSHERTRALVGLQGPGEGRPTRQPDADPDAEKAMLAWQHKQQQLQQALEQDQDDSYVNSAWADPHALKQHFSGVPRALKTH